MSLHICESNIVCAFDHKSKMTSRDSWGHSQVAEAEIALLSSPGRWGWHPGGHAGSWLWDIPSILPSSFDSNRLQHCRVPQ